MSGVKERAKSQQFLAGVLPTCLTPIKQDVSDVLEDDSSVPPNSTKSWWLSGSNTFELLLHLDFYSFKAPTLEDTCFLSFGVRCDKLHLMESIRTEPQEHPESVLVLLLLGGSPDMLAVEQYSSRLGQTEKTIWTLQNSLCSCV